MIELIASMLVMIMASGICSGSEAALFSISINKVRQLYEEGKCSKVFLSVVENRDSFVSTITFLNNIVNIAGSMYIGSIAAKYLGSGTGYAAFSIFLTLSIIIWAEILPKTIGAKKSIPIMIRMSSFLTASRWVLYPAVMVTTKFCDWLLLKLLGDVKEEPISEAEIGHLVNVASKDISSDVRPSEAELVKSVFKIHDTKAKDIMTPSTQITKLLATDKLGDVEEKIMSFQHSRVIITGEESYDILGIVLKEDLLIALAKGERESLVSDLNIRPIRKVGETVNAESLLRILRNNTESSNKSVPLIASVTDEFGGISGIVTLEDVLEILVGEIVDETDLTVDLQEEAKMKKRAVINA